MRRVRTPERAFVLQELLVLLIVFGAALAVLVVASSRSRSLASLGESIANLKKMHQATMSFADDNQSLFATFSWRKGDSPSQYPDLVSAATDLQAAANQAVDIIRRRGDFPTMPRVTSWIPHVSYSHLVLSEYLDTQLPHRWVISPEDPMRLAFSLDRSQWESAGREGRLAFSSSYEIPVTFWSSPDSGNGAVYGHQYNFYTTSTSTQWGNRRLDEVVYPAHKAVLYDRHQRHFGPRQGYFMHQEARVPVATVDGAVSVRRGKDANLGWQPTQPESPSPSFIIYNPPPLGPLAWDPPALHPSGIEQVEGRYRFTRQALRGRDVDGPEVP